MDITVTRAADDRRAWTLTDLLGRPMAIEAYAEIVGRAAPAKEPERALSA